MITYRLFLRNHKRPKTKRTTTMTTTKTNIVTKGPPNDAESAASSVWERPASLPEATPPFHEAEAVEAEAADAFE